MVRIVHVERTDNDSYGLHCVYRTKDQTES